MLRLDKLSRARKPDLPHAARGRRRRQVDSATQTVVTVSTQTGAAEAGQVQGQPAAEEPYEAVNPAPVSIQAARERQRRGSGHAQAASARPSPPARAPADRAPLGRGAVDSQTENADALLRRHQQQARTRAEEVRQDRRAAQKAWFGEMRNSLSALEDEPPRAPPTPSGKETRAVRASLPSNPLRARDANVLEPVDAGQPELPGSQYGAMLQHRAPPAVHSFPSSRRRSSLESLVELESLLEEQHRQLVEKGYIPASYETS